jgi:hypothetical protein
MLNASKGPRVRTGARWRLCALAAAAALTMLGSERSASAQEPSPGAVAAAREMLEIKSATTIFDPLIPGVIESAKNTLLSTSPALAKDLNDVAAQLRAEYAPKRADIATQIARTYAEQFSEKELRELIVFYKSPVGKKLIAIEPQILEQSMRRVQSWADQLSDQMMGRFRAEMKKKGHTL